MGLMCAVLAIDFTRSGRIYLATASARDLGVDGYLWYSTAYTNVMNMQIFHFVSDKLFPDAYHPRWTGLTLRCLAG